MRDFLIDYRAADQLVAYDGREMAPAGADPAMFREEDETMGFLRAWQSGLAVCVPGAIALYEYAHERHGRLTMLDNLQAAMEKKFVQNKNELHPPLPPSKKKKKRN